MESAIRPTRSWIRKLMRIIGLLSALAVVALAVVTIWAWTSLKGSLPQLEGQVKLDGLESALRVERDGLGIPTIYARSRVDLARGIGFLHAQDRFFQMDLMRRSAAGELSALLGRLTLETDRHNRKHRFRALAKEVVSRASQEERELLDAYASGVNQGLANLEDPPFEYLVLRADPQPWTDEDSILVIYFMYIFLQSQGGSESALGLMKDVLPVPVFDFLNPKGSSWDAPLLGAPFAAPPIPGPELIDLRSEPPVEGTQPGNITSSAELPVPGSNNWAVAGGLTANGGALVANDMHLSLGVPNTWYRLSWVLSEKGTRSGAGRVTGASLPGFPAMVVGSNGSIAWGFTNTQGDWSDLVLLEADPQDPDRYLTPAASRSYENHEERIEIKGEGAELIDVPWTIWGPVWDEDHRGRRRALRWVAHDPEAVNLQTLRFAEATSVDEAVEIANRCGLPAQNLVVADREGRIAWTVAGLIPRREGCDGSVPVSWADGKCRWNGWLDPSEYPRIVDPPEGRLWTANNRTLDGEALKRMGDGGYGNGARAKQIRDGLRELDAATPEDMLAIQLDDRALFLARWRELLLSLLDDVALAEDSSRREYRDLVQTCSGSASVDSVGYVLVSRFRTKVMSLAFEPLLKPCREADESYRMRIRQAEAPLWRLVSERPEHLLNPEFGSWRDLFLSVVDEQVEEGARRRGGLAAGTWGSYNRSSIRHPLSRALPFLSRYLDMPALPLPGDTKMPRVQRPSFGASERMAVSPGRESEGIFHMPAGQSGHPLSPHYSDGHMAWVNGEATPFLPGETVHTLVLEP